MELQWQWCAFDKLETTALYALMVARQEVFVVEQKCPYPDLDGRDVIAHHLLGWDTTGDKPRLAAYLRTLPPKTRFAEPSIGRVLTTAAYRSQRLGHPLMAQGIVHAVQTYGQQPIRLFAQSHLQGFYAKHGFVGVGEEYPEDGIPHREMLRD